jgi:hypothetical protein
MPILVRRINRAKWDNLEEDDDVCADAITSCLKTSNNDLSVWRITSEEELDQAILALITGGKQTQLNTLHYVLIEEDLLIDHGLSLKESPGDTAVDELVYTHRDIEKLTYLKLGKIKDLIINSIRTERTNHITKRQLKAVLVKAINEGKLDKNRLNSELVRREKL